MSNITNISFGSDVKFSAEEIQLGENFFNKDSINAGKLSTELYKGQFSVSNKVADNFPVFNAFDSKSSPENSLPPIPPSTRPYIWKYQ
jgi:hypothetical protein